MLPIMARLLVVIPAFNEEATIGQVLNSLPKTLSDSTFLDTVVIDDGSTDRTADVVKKHRVTLLHHIINRGLGAALGTGFDYARKKQYDFVVTFDADCQHDAKDIARMIIPLQKRTVDIVIGSRWLDKTNMPFIRRIVNYLSNLVTFLLFNVWTTDSQSGLRAFSRSAIKRMMIRSQHMEVSSEIFKEINRLNLPFVEIPIRAIYTDYSLKKGQPISNAPVVFWKLLLHRFI